MKIKVKRRHIDNGHKGNCCHCPIALAIKDKFPQTKVTVNYITCNIGGSYIKLPEMVTDFIEAFDYDELVVPFEFELDYET